MPDRSREIRLASRPVGSPTPENFELADTEVRDPGFGEVLVANRWLSVDPYMRGRMNDTKSYLPPFRIGEALQGGAVGEVVSSRSPEVEQGSWVMHMQGWRELAVVNSEHLQHVDPELAPPRTALGVLGMPGLTAYAGMLDIAGVGEGERVFVSAAAGAVGSIAGQIAKLRGCEVIGSVGSREKLEYVTGELGFDSAFVYRDRSPADALAELAPQGIDVYFDNVGGDHLEAAIGTMRPFGRIALCGMIGDYNATEPPPGPRNMTQLVGRRVTMRGFLVIDHYERLADFQRDMGAWVRDGSVKMRETVVKGVENMPDAFLGLLEGRNIGKMLVEVG